MKPVARATVPAALILTVALGACSTLQDADPTGLLGENEKVEPRKVASPDTDEDAGYPNLASVPQEPPRRPSRKAERDALKSGLAADRANAVYSDEPLRAATRPARQAPNGTGRTPSGPDEPGSPPERPTILSEGPTGEPEMPQQPKAPSAKGGADGPQAGAAGNATQRAEAPTGEGLEYAATAIPAPERTPSRKPSVPAADGLGSGAEAGEPAAPPGTPATPSPPETAQAGAEEPAEAARTGEADEAGKAGEAPGETQTAALPPADAVLPERLRLSFEGTDTALSPRAQTDLAALASRLEANPDARIQIRAFAAPTDDTGSQARRLSLKRALAVRAFLAARGVRSTRMDVRALGGSTDETPRDRVDILPAAK